MRYLLPLLLLCSFAANAQMPLSVQCGGQSEYLGGFFGLGRMLQCDSGYDWYVDSSVAPGGAGTEADPFATIAELDAVQAENESVCFVAGSHWREQWDALAGMTSEQCGTGAKPIFDGSDVIEDWTLDGGTPGVDAVYSKQVTVATANQFVRVFEDDQGLLWNATLRLTCDTGASLAAGTYCVKGWDTTTPTIYLRTTGSDAPSNYTIEVPVRDYAINGGYSTDVGGVTVSGISAIRSLHTDGAIIAGPNWRLVGNETSGTNEHAVWLAEGCTVEGLDVYDTYGKQNQSAGNSGAILSFDSTAGHTAGISISNVSCTNAPTDPGYGLGTCVQSHGTVNREFFYVDGLDFSGMASVYSGASALDIQLKNVDATLPTGVDIGITLGLETDAVASVLLEDVSVVGGDERSIYVLDKLDAITLRRATLHPEASTDYAYYTTSATVTALTVENSIVWGRGPRLLTAGVGSTATFTGNTFYVGSSGYMVPENTLTSDGNDFKVFATGLPLNPATGNLFQVGATQYSLNGMLCTFGQEANSTPAPGACPGAFVAAFAPAFN